MTAWGIQRMKMERRHGDRAQRHERDERERERDMRVRDMTGIREREGERHDRPEGIPRNKT